MSERQSDRQGDRYIPPGTSVRIPWIDEDGNPAPEYGIMIHCWFDELMGVHDCLFASFGDALPSGNPGEKPAIFRYTAPSFDILSD